MLTGSLASAYYGTPRSTQDIDMVIAATPEQLRILVQSLPADEYYVDLESALDALHRNSLFNVVDLITGWKIDLIFRKPRNFSQEEFRRRRPLAFQGLRLFVATAEDIVLAKLEWAKLAVSTRQIEDVAGILKLQKAPSIVSTLRNGFANSGYRSNGARHAKPKNSEVLPPVLPAAIRFDRDVGQVASESSICSRLTCADELVSQPILWGSPIPAAAAIA